jgi:hypothetical protein
MKTILLLLFVVLLCSCDKAMVGVNKIDLDVDRGPVIKRVRVENDQIIVTGKNLNVVTAAKVQGGLNHTFTIESKTRDTLVLNARSSLNFLVGQVLSLVLSSAYADAIYPLNFELQNGQVTAAKLNHMGASVNQFLRFNGTSWAPASLLYGQTYAGAYDANSDTPDIVALGGAAGTYYIVSVAGTQDVGAGPTNFDIGDLVVFNGTIWERVPVGSTSVTSFNGRSGVVVPLSGDYSWSMLTQAGGKITGSSLSEIADVDVSAVQDGDILKWDAGASTWISGPDVVAISDGSVTNTKIAANAVDSSKINDSSIVNADVSPTAAIAQSKIANLTADLAAKEPLLATGAATDYYRGDKVWRDLATDVRGTALTGYAVDPMPTALSAVDTIIGAFGKLEGFINQLESDLDDAGLWTKATNDVYYNTGNVTIGSTTVQANTKLDVNGQIRSGSASIASGNVNFGSGNTITTSFDCSSDITFANLRDGGSYTLIVTDPDTTQCDFDTTLTGDDAGVVTFRYRPANGLRTASSHTVYSLIRAGNIVYVSWISGF